MRALAVTGLLLLAFALGGAAYWLSGEIRRATVAVQDREAAVQVARAHAVNLLSISHESVDEDIRRLLVTSTGKAKAEYTRNAAKLKADTLADKVVRTGVVRSFGLVSMEGGTARVLVVADVLIRSEGEESPREHFYRWDMKVTKVGHAWLVSEAVQVP